MESAASALRLYPRRAVIPIERHDMKAVLAIALATTIMIGRPVSAHEPPERAIRNYLAVIHGRRPFQDLSPVEQAEVAEIARLLNRRGIVRTSAEECRKEEIRRRGGAPGALELRIIDLQCSQR